MNNEPVAWMLVDEINGDYMLERHPSGDYDWIPLYTHPANACKHGVDDGACKECYLEATHPAELTDEEIDEISKEVWERPWLEVHRKFAKAILRKASEK